MLNIFWWAIANLIVPLFAIPAVMLMQWMLQKRPSWQAIIEDGQICFYSIAILAAAWYDQKELSLHGHPIFGADAWIMVVGALATLGYGIMASDHVGAKTISRNRAAVVSVVIALASIAVALYVHILVAGAARSPR